MQIQDRVKLLKARLNTVIARGKTEEFPGVRRKIERQIRTLEAKIN